MLFRSGYYVVDIEDVKAIKYFSLYKYIEFSPYSLKPLFF